MKSRSGLLRRMLAALMSALLVLGTTGPVTAEPRHPVDYILNGSDRSAGTDPAPYSVPVYDGNGRYIGDRTMFPLRVVSEDLGAVVDFVPTGDGHDNVIVATRHRLAIFSIGSPRYTYYNMVNGEWDGGHDVFMDVSPELKAGRTMLPLRYVSEAIGATVSFDSRRGLPVLSYTDGPSDWELDQAAEFAQVDRRLVRSSLTDTEIYDLADVQTALDECGGIRGTLCGVMVPHQIPVAYARALYLKMKAAGGGQVDEGDENFLSTVLTMALGFTPSRNAIRSLAQEGEGFVDEIARTYN